MTTPEETSPPANVKPNAKVTAALVDRVAERLAMGMPLKIALAGENVTCAEYKDALRESPELQDLQDLGKRKVLENAYSILLQGDQAPANWRWLIEIVYKDVLGSQDEDFPKQKQTIFGFPEEILNQIRENAKRL
ncbi:MAG TPA: hypothetical protein VH280_05030 [Verrucomicrobiae bacterium]|jgi:hypothetical protein|nr:hypothetical protein [Verrucomicrobiae bacterium]